MPGTLRVVAGPTCETLRSSVQWLISQDVCQQCRQCQLRPCVPPTSTRGALRANRKAWVAASRVAAAVSTRWLLDQTGASCTAGQSGKVWRVSRDSIRVVQAKSTSGRAASSMRKSICAMFALLISSLIVTTRTRCGLNCPSSEPVCEHSDRSRRHSHGALVFCFDPPARNSHTLVCRVCVLASLPGLFMRTDLLRSLYGAHWCSPRASPDVVQCN